ncbi:MAG: trehalase family glycosidase [Stappiaceae bacterium]
MQPDLDASAKAILRQNDLGGYTIPTKGLYPYQWNWDSAFSALGIATYDMNRAWQEIETLFEGQWIDGMVPHIVFRKNDPDYFPGPTVWGASVSPPTSGISQPPVVATVLRALWEGTDRSAYRQRLHRLFPKIMHWHRWFHTYRDPDDLGVIATVHPWETGRDNSAEWDQALAAVDVSGIEAYERRDTGHVDPSMRPHAIEYDRYLGLVKFCRDINWDPEKVARECPFFVADVGLTMILLRADRDLLWMAVELGEHDAVAEISGWISAAEQGVTRLWNDDLGAYTALDLRSGQRIDHITSSTFLAWYAGVGNGEKGDRLLDHLERFWTRAPYGVPSLDPDDARFDSIRYWLGPVWLVVNYMIACGLFEQGQQDVGERIRMNSRELVKRAGFYESFCPVTGKGCGGGDFSWSAAMWLAWATPGGLKAVA